MPTLSRKPSKQGPHPLDTTPRWRRPIRANGARFAHRARGQAEGFCHSCGQPRGRHDATCAWHPDAIGA